MNKWDGRQSCISEDSGIAEGYGNGSRFHPADDDQESMQNQWCDTSLHVRGHRSRASAIAALPLACCFCL